MDGARPRRGPTRHAVAAVAALGASCLSCRGALPGSSRGAAEAHSPDLEPFLRSYFDTWSSGDMRAYAYHFHPDATVVTLRNGTVADVSRRDRFITVQAALRQRAGAPPVERMLSYTADEDTQAATVSAQWELTARERGRQSVRRGVDRFTLMRDERGRWKIISLIFYLTD